MTYIILITVLIRRSPPTFTIRYRLAARSRNLVYNALRKTIIFKIRGFTHNVSLSVSNSRLLVYNESWSFNCQFCVQSFWFCFLLAMEEKTGFYVAVSANQKPETANCGRIYDVFYNLALKPGNTKIIPQFDRLFDRNSIFRPFQDDSQTAGKWKSEGKNANVLTAFVF